MHSLIKTATNMTRKHIFILILHVLTNHTSSFQKLQDNGVKGFILMLKTILTKAAYNLSCNFTLLRVVRVPIHYTFRCKNYSLQQNIMTFSIFPLLLSFILTSSIFLSSLL